MANDTLQKIHPNYQKLFISLRYFLLGMMEHAPEYKRALDALEYAASIHVGTRKDGTTPEFQHQLEIAQLIRTYLPYLLHPVETLAAVFLHDTPEDYPVSRAELEQRFGKLTTDAVMLLNKYDEFGVAKATDAYYQAIGACPIASVVKPGDRAHNQSTMGGVFNFAKQAKYVAVTRNHILPMAKEARRRFPEQEKAYENLKFILRIQCNQTLSLLSAVGFDSATGKATLVALPDNG
jgi:(p)ppGpp synthase/HD superfamily hydrolase